MATNTIYFRSNDSIEAKDKLENIFKTFYDRRKRSMNNFDDENVQKQLSIFYDDIVLHYHDELLKVDETENTLYLFEKTLLTSAFLNKFDNYNDVEQQLKVLSNIGTFLDSNNNQLSLNDVEKQIKNLIVSQKHLSQTIKETRRADYSMSLLNQFFYLGKTSAMSLVGSIQKKIVNAILTNSEYYNDIQSYINNNLMTTLLISLVPQSCIMIGQVASGRIPVIFEIPGMWMGTNAPMFLTNFIDEHVPADWQLYNTPMMIHSDFDFARLVKFATDTFYTDSNIFGASAEDKTFYDFAFFNETNTINRFIPLNKIVDQYQNKGLQSMYHNSPFSIYVKGPERYLFEIANYGAL